MLTDSSLKRTVVFDIDSESATNGKFVITDTTDYAGEGIAPADVIGYYDIDYPDGTTRQGTFSSPDYDGSSSLVFNTLNIPTDANGDYMEGTYTFTQHVRVAGAVDPGDYSSAASFKYCPTIPSAPTITHVLDCLCLKLTGTDGTSYGTPTTMTRVFTLTPPPNLGLSVVTTNDDTLPYQFSYTGAYYFFVNTALTYVSGDFTIQARVKSSGSGTLVTVECDNNFCALVKCYNAYVENLMSKAGSVGGIHNLPSADRDKLDEILTKYIGFNESFKCGESTKVQDYYDSLKELLNCSCGCASSEAPQLVDPYCGSTGSNATVYTLNAGTGIKVVLTTGTNTVNWVVSLSDATNALLVDLATMDVDLAILPGQDRFNTAVGVKAILEVSNTGTGYNFDPNVGLVGPESYHQVGDIADPLYFNTSSLVAVPYVPVGTEIMVLGTTSGSNYVGAYKYNNINPAGTPDISSFSGNELNFRQTVDGHVEMKGAIQASYANNFTPYTIGGFGFQVIPICRLPANYRPAERRRFAVGNMVFLKQPHVEVYPNGDVFVVGWFQMLASSPSTFNDFYFIYFDNVHYNAAT